MPKTPICFICEGMYGEQDKEEKAKAHKHMTFQGSSTSGKRSAGKRAVAHTHSPSLYARRRLSPEAMKVFPNTIVARTGSPWNCSLRRIIRHPALPEFCEKGECKWRRKMRMY